MLCKKALVFRPAVLRIRSYALNYKQPKEESQAYGEFRRKLTALRKQYQEEWQEQQKMKMEAFSAKAAEEGQMRRLQEARALEKNRRELERMAKKRCCLQLMPTSVTEKLMISLAGQTRIWRTLWFQFPLHSECVMCTLEPAFLPFKNSSVSALALTNPSLCKGDEVAAHLSFTVPGVCCIVYCKAN